MKAYSSKKWTDGIDTFNASYISLMTSLCALVMMQLRYTVPALTAEMLFRLLFQHISVTNSILTPDTAHPINIGTHGDPTLPGGGNAIDSLQLFEPRHLELSSRLAYILTASDGNLITDVTFTDLRIEDNSAGRIADAITYKNSAFGTWAGEWS